MNSYASRFHCISQHTMNMTNCAEKTNSTSCRSGSGSECGQWLLCCWSSHSISVPWSATSLASPRKVSPSSYRWSSSSKRSPRSSRYGTSVPLLLASRVEDRTSTACAVRRTRLCMAVSVCYQSSTATSGQCIALVPYIVRTGRTENDVYFYLAPRLSHVVWLTGQCLNWLIHHTRGHFFYTPMHSWTSNGPTQCNRWYGRSICPQLNEYTESVFILVW